MSQAGRIGRRSLGSGRQSVRELERTLAIIDRSLDSFESILDFGCGCGRMLLWLEEIGRTRSLHGTDIDKEAIAWCRAHLPYVRVSVNGPDPPLPYPDRSFDLVFNHSGFTHIDERRPDLWLTELLRVTRTGGFVVLSVHGEVALPGGSWELRDRLEHDGSPSSTRACRESSRCLTGIRTPGTPPGTSSSTGDDGLRSAATCPGLLWDCRTMSYSSGDLTAHDRVSRSLPAQGCVRMKYLPTAYETLSEARGLTAISRTRSSVARS